MVDCRHALERFAECTLNKSTLHAFTVERCHCGVAQQSSALRAYCPLQPLRFLSARRNPPRRGCMERAKSWRDAFFLVCTGQRQLHFLSARRNPQRQCVVEQVCARMWRWPRCLGARLPTKSCSETVSQHKRTSNSMNGGTFF